jgi:fido (protein-threonine AMPylation protein)
VTREAAKAAAERLRQEREGVLVSSRIEELFESPITGAFDIQHLKAIHAYLFQDFPDHKPGIIRERTEDAWIKHRALEGQSEIYLVY